VNPQGAMAGEIKIEHKPDSLCTHILWQDATVYFAFDNGTFATAKQEDFIPSKKAPVAKQAMAPTTTSPSITTEASKASVSEAKKPEKEPTATTDSDDEDVDFDVEEDVTKKTKVLFIDDEADDADSVSPSETPNLPPSSDNLDEVMVDDEEDDFEDDDNFDAPASSANGRLMQLPEPQPAFAPSSTPLDMTRRIMCWNHIGAITLLRGDDGTTRNTVDIDFTDSAFRRPVSFTDNMDFIIGSLGEDGAFFASDLTEGDVDREDDLEQVVDGLNMSDKTKAAVRKSHEKRMKKGKEGHKSTGSSIYFHRFETFGSLSNKDWVVTLPDAELALGCACGEGWAACITNRRFLRTFTSGGNQGPVLWLKGEPVTIVGRGRFVAVIYHEGMPMPDGTQKLGFSIYDAISSETITAGSLACISSRSSLRWAGFSKEGSLMVMDTDGMLSMLASVEKSDSQNDSKMFTWTWSPILDTVGLRKSLEDSFWPVTAQDGKLICVPLKGGNEHPDAARRPVTTALSMRMPFAYSSDKT
jgi:chromosome transmission fidelity protein 4